VLGTPSAVAAVTGLFAVIRTTIKEAHMTIRDRQSQQHDLQKLVLVLGARREEIDLAKNLYSRLNPRAAAARHGEIGRLEKPR
jgi:hypothetical protein